MNEPRSRPSFAARAGAERARFLAALKQPKVEQDALFRRYIDLNVGTVFGREHGFSQIKTLDDYRRSVPIRNYDELFPWIERIVGGERNVLSAADPTLFLTTTGTTGRPKLIPATREYFNLSIRNLLTWWANVIVEFPEVVERDDSLVMLHLAPKPYSEFAARNIPIHVNTCMPPVSESGFPYSRAPWYPPPAELSDAERIYYLLRKSVAHDVIGFLCLHSSRFQATVLCLAESGPRLVQELFDGTVCGQASGEPDPTRARQLEALMARGPLRPRDVWPRIQFTSCWTGGTLALFKPDIEAAFGGIVLPQASSSSEVGHMTMAIDRQPLDGPLTVQTNFYEFLPAGENAGDGKDTLTFDQLEQDGVYEMVVTTCAGLYRYVCGDRFRVIGFVDGVPRMEFIGRSGVSDLTGEKITEQHVTAAITSALAANGLRATNATCCAVFAKPSHYTFVFEPSGEWSAGVEARLAVAVDEELKRQGPRYRMKRGWGDLGAAEVRVVGAGVFARYREQRIAQGVPGTQLKDRVLNTDPAVLAALQKLDTDRS